MSENNVNNNSVQSVEEDDARKAIDEMLTLFQCSLEMSNYDTDINDLSLGIYGFSMNNVMSIFNNDSKSIDPHIVALRESLSVDMKMMAELENMVNENPYISDEEAFNKTGMKPIDIIKLNSDIMKKIMILKTYMDTNNQDENGG